MRQQGLDRGDEQGDVKQDAAVLYLGADMERGEGMSSKLSGFKYRFSNTEFTAGKKTYSICNACGEEHQGNFGYYYEFQMRNHWAFGRIKLCRKCAKEFVEPIAAILKETTDRVDEKYYAIKKSKMVSGRKLRGVRE